MEIWKDIPGYEGLYQASTMGGIRRLERVDPLGRIWPAKDLIPQRLSNGYYLIRLKRTSEKAKGYGLHRVIVMTFIGASDLSVDHLDGDPSNNRLDNLEYVTSRENSIRAYKRIKKNPGVNFCEKTGKWRARIYFNKKDRILGTFGTEEEAVCERERACREIDEKGILTRPHNIRATKKLPKHIQKHFNRYTVKKVVDGKIEYLDRFDNLEDAINAKEEFVGEENG